MMTPERWQRVRDVLEQAMELAPEKRGRFLDMACSSDPSLRSEVQSLLSADEEARSSFLESPPLSPAALSPGTKLGEYQIISQIGSGGMGVVYRAKDLHLDRDVAIKVLPAHLSADGSRLKRFEQEAKSAAALNHPNILAVHQLGTYQGAPYLVSELLEGETLREELRQGALPQQRAMDYAEQIADGLNAAHEKGIIHRDLKPENLFVTKDNRVKILDFGLAKLALGDSESAETVATIGLQTHPGMIAGTVGYMSPEQVRGEKLDTRTDLFSFGVVLYEMATGKRPFEGDTSGVTFEAILNRQPTPPTKLNAKVAPGLENIITKALEKDRDIRYQHASDIRADLKRLKRDTESGHTASHAGSTQTKRKATWVWAVVAGALLLATGFLIYKRPWARVELKKTPVQRELTANTPENPFGAPKLSPDGKQLVYSDRLHGISLLQIDSGEKRTYPDSKGLYVYSWYPDGAHLLIANRGTKTTLWKMSTLDGSRKKVIELDDQVWGAPSPDGKTILFSKDYSSELWTMNADGQDLHRILSVAPSSIANVSWSPTSQRIAYLRFEAANGNPEYAIESCDRAGNDRKTILNELRLGLNAGLSDLKWLSDSRLVYALSEAPPNDKYDNLWCIRVDPTTGDVRGVGTQITYGNGFTHFGLTASADAKRMAFDWISASETRAFVAPINEREGKLGSAIPLGGERWEKWPHGWTADSHGVFYSSNVQGKWGLYEQQIATSESKLMMALPDGYGNPAVTPDGQWVLYTLTSYDEHQKPKLTKLMRAPVNGGPPTVVMDDFVGRDYACATRANICAMSEPRDGKTVFSLLDPLRGRGAEFGEVDSPAVDTWAISPDGKQIAYVPRENDSEIRFVSSDGKHIAPINLGAQKLRGLVWSADQNFLYISGFSGQDGNIQLLSFDGRVKTLRRYPIDEAWVFVSDVSPDGHYLTYTEKTFVENLNLLEDF